MEKFDIKIKQGRQELAFEVRDYLHYEGEKCKIELYQDNELVLSFNPDQHEHLTVCKNPGNLENKLVHLIADKLETYNL